MTLRTVRYRRRVIPRVRARDRCTRRLARPVVVTHVRPATSRLDIREVHILRTVTVIVAAGVIRVARRTTDRINTKGTRSVKVFRVITRQRIRIRMTQRTPGRARLPRSRVRSTQRRIVARSVRTAVRAVHPRRYRHTSLVLASRSTVGKGRARNVTRIHGQRPLVTIRTVVASREVVTVIIRQR